VTGDRQTGSVPVPIAPPVVAYPTPPRWARWLRPTGVVLVVVGGLVLVAMMFFAMLTAMSDPATPWVGFVPGPDGAPTAVVQRSGAADVTQVLVEASETDRTVLWAVDRTPGSDWDGVVRLGTVPAGFSESTALRAGPVPAGSTLVVTNGCYASYVTVPSGPLTPGVVTTEDGELGQDEFYGDGGGFTPCGPEEFRTPARIAVGGLLLVFAGVTALVVTARRRFR
jgi:hypothetical protein